MSSSQPPRQEEALRKDANKAFHTAGDIRSKRVSAHFTQEGAGSAEEEVWQLEGLYKRQITKTKGMRLAQEVRCAQALDIAKDLLTELRLEIHEVARQLRERYAQSSKKKGSLLSR